MKLRLTVNRPGQESADIAITYDSSATVADVAAELYLADPLSPDRRGIPSGLTLAEVGHQTRTLNPDGLVIESGLRSAQTIALTRSGEQFVEVRRQAAAELIVLEGPDAGQKFGLPSGSSVVGRGAGCDVQLTDTMVSRQHLRVNVAEHVEVIDLGSANGILVNDEVTDRETVQVGDRVMIGDTTFSIRPLQSMATVGRVEATAVGFIRSPRLAPIYPGEPFAGPEVPERPRPGRFPVFLMIAPILMAVVMWMMTQQLLSLIFMAMMPLMIVASYVDELVFGKRSFKKAVEQWRLDVSQLCDDLAEANEREVASRLAEHPSVAECVTATRDLLPLLWTRRPEMPGFAEFRFGLGSASARSTIDMPDAKRAPRHLYAELTDALKPLRTVHDVPIVVRPFTEGGIGVAGPRSVAVDAARAVVVQAASLHSPEDLVLAAIASPRTAVDWDWLKWIPHCLNPSSPLEAHLAQSTGGAGAVLAGIETLIAKRAEAKQKKGEVPTPAVLLVVESDAPAEFGRLVDIAETGWRHGVFVLWVATELGQLPATCRVFLETRASAEGRVGFVHVGEEVSPVTVETISGQAVEDWARRIGPVTDLATRSEDSSDVPRSVNLLSLSGFDPMIDDNFVIERWQANRSIVVGPLAPQPLVGKSGGLRAVIGQGAAGPHSLDLRADGPHALVGGTTGSGKSELLQTWILAMASTYSPQRLNFLLVDYKGGSAFADCNNLPHTVGLVTDLNKNGVRRALTSLAAELHYRELLITDQHRCKDLPTMEKKFPALAPPSLVIVVDEFAALVQEVPEFIDGVVNVAQRGRSLGLHMILATQQPSGVIKGPLRANTNLRLALRVADVDDSQDILASPQAAFFDQDTPGRAVSKTGPGRLVPFQTGYVGGHSGLGTSRAEVVVQELKFGAGQVWERSATPETEAGADRGPADISRIVTAVQNAARTASLPAPRKPWLPDLATHYDLSREVPTRRSDTELVFGIMDDPDHQQQTPVAFHPDQEGNLVIYGASGAGKTTLLRTLAVAAGFTVRGGPCHVYGLDFSSRGLDSLECLPHVGSIINGADDERVARLIDWLRQVVVDRSERFGQVTASNLTEYRRLSGNSQEARLLILIDGIAAFRTAYEPIAKTRYWDLLTEIAAQGRAVGVHFVMTSDQRSGLSQALASSVQRKVVMRMASAEDYGMIGVPTSILAADSPPGRCVVDDAEVQVAVLGSGSDASEQAEALAQFAVAMQHSGVAAAPQIRRLPELVALGELAESRDAIRIGMYSEGFATATVAPLGTFVISGAAGSGRSAALRLVAAELRRLRIPTHLLADRRSELTAADGWASVHVGGEKVAAALDDLVAELTEASRAQRRHAVLIEGMGELANSEAEYGLSGVIRAAASGDHFVVAEGETNSLGQAYDAMKRFKAGRRGLVLQPDDDMGSVVQASFPRCKSSDFVPGRGFLVERGMPQLVQVAMAPISDG